MVLSIRRKTQKVKVETEEKKEKGKKNYRSTVSRQGRPWEKLKMRMEKKWGPGQKIQETTFAKT